MRLYQGVDIVDISKIKRIMERNPSFAPDIFTDRERDYCWSFREPYARFAGRFAAKEACAKALGKGFLPFGIDHAFQEIEVLLNASGKPYLELYGWTAKVCHRRKADQQTVSISHASQYSVATVILLGP
jgi:holo-[acyl-carrier protein] synthase